MKHNLLIILFVLFVVACTPRSTDADSQNVSITTSAELWNPTNTFTPKPSSPASQTAATVRETITPTKQFTRAPSPTETPTPIPTFSTYQLSGALLLSVNGAAVVDEVVGPYNPEIIAINLTPGKPSEARVVVKGFGLSVSPDRRHLAYTTFGRGTLAIMDWNTGDPVEVKGAESNCLDWSPDSMRFTFLLGNRLLVSDLEGKTITLWEGPVDYYQEEGSKRIEEVFTRTECGHWIGQDRIVFKRFTGPMPKRIPFSSGYYWVPANTMSMAILKDDRVSLIDSSEQTDIDFDEIYKRRKKIRLENVIFLNISLGSFRYLNICVSISHRL